MKHALTNSPSWLLFIASILPAIACYYDFRLVPYAILITTLLLAGWAWPVTKALSRKNSYDPKLKFKKFREILFLAVLYIVLASIFFTVPDLNASEYQWVPWVFTLGGFIWLFWFIFLLKFIARSIATLEQQKPVGFDQYAGYFFGLFFFPLGIWWVNPKIKKLLRG